MPPWRRLAVEPSACQGLVQAGDKLQTDVITTAVHVTASATGYPGTMVLEYHGSRVPGYHVLILLPVEYSCTSIDRYGYSIL